MLNKFAFLAVEDIMQQADLLRKLATANTITDISKDIGSTGDYSSGMGAHEQLGHMGAGLAGSFGPVGRMVGMASQAMQGMQGVKDMGNAFSNLKQMLPGQQVRQDVPLFGNLEKQYG